MKKILILWLILIPINASAFDKWSKQDKILEGMWLALQVIDWGQTLYIADHPEQYYERNSLLGDHPDRGRVNFIFALSVPLHLGLTYILPAKYRPYFQMITMGMSGFCVLNNFHAGIGFSF